MRVAPLPDISRLDPSLKEQLRRDHDALSMLDGSSGDTAARYGELGMRLLAAEYAEAAEPFLARAQALDPRDLRWPYYQGHMHLARHAPQQAVPFFERVVQLDPNHVVALIWLGTTELTLGRAASAADHFSKATRLDATSVAAWFGLGRAAHAAGEHAAAVAHFERALTLAPDADAVHYQLGLAYRSLGDTARAERHLARRADADSIRPRDPLMDALRPLVSGAPAHLTRGLEAMERRDWRAAVDSLRAASELAPHDGVVWLNLGTALFLSGDAGARNAFERAVRESPDLPRAHYSLGLLEEAERRDTAAIERFTIATRLDASYAEAHASLADALRRTGSVAASLEQYARVLALEPAASQARFGYAMALVRLERYREARDWLRDAATLHPDQPGFPHALARLLAAAPDASVRDGREALALIERLLATQRSVALYETLAMALAETGRFDEAVRWQEDAIAAARQLGQPEVAERLAPNLARYRRREPCRTPWAAGDPVHFPRPQTG